jgi:pimeloyl-ACP methyl ester carboxylesterase
VPELAADAARLLDALEVESAHVLGPSFGGMLAQELAIRFPERVRALVLAGATPGGPRAVLPNLDELAAILGQAVLALPRERPPWIRALLFSPAFRRRHPERVRELVPLFLRHLPPPWGIAAHWWASVYHDTVSRLPEIQAPTLVMHGERDGMAPVGAAHLLAERIPDAELAIVPRRGTTRRTSRRRTRTPTTRASGSRRPPRTRERGGRTGPTGSESGRGTRSTRRRSSARTITRCSARRRGTYVRQKA